MDQERIRLVLKLEIQCCVSVFLKIHGRPSLDGIVTYIVVDIVIFVLGSYLEKCIWKISLR